MVTRLHTSRLHTPRNHFRRTNMVLYRLIRASVEAGIFCTIFAVGNMVAFGKTFYPETMLADIALDIVAMPRTHLCGMLAFPIGRIYTNVSIPHSYLHSYLSIKNQTSHLLDSYGLFKHAGSAERYFGRTTNGVYLFPLCISRV